MKIKIKNPVVEKVGNLQEGTAFWKKRDRSLYLVIKENCYTRACLADAERTWPEEKGNMMIVFNLSLHLITTIKKDTDVVVATNTEMISYPITTDDYSHLEALETHKQYRNFYRCPDCDTEWQDVWTATCNDKCPDCNKEIEPYKSEDV